MLAVILCVVSAVLALYCILQHIMILTVAYFIAEKGIEMSEEDLKRCKKAVVYHLLRDLI